MCERLCERGPDLGRNTPALYAGEVGGADTTTLATRGVGSSTIAELALVEIGSVTSFNWADARSLWTAPVGRVAGTETPFFVQLGPDSKLTSGGPSGSAAPDWAAVVTRGLGSLASRHLPFTPGETQVCLSVRNNPLDRTTQGAWRVRVLDDGVERLSEALTPSESRTQVCTRTFAMTSAAGTLELGLEPAGVSSQVGSYLVDDIPIQRP